MEFKGNLPSTEPSLSDWEWVKKQIAEDAPIPYDPSDPDDGPYDPNDDAAVDAFFDKVTINTNEPNLRRNRLGMLALLRDDMHMIADFSKIEG